MQTNVLIFTDGASRGNPGPGGWAAIVIAEGEVHEYAGADGYTTNNRMELTAAVEGLSHVKTGLSVTVYTDSRYLINGITKWVFGWQKNGWINSQKEEVQNRDLWERLIDAVKEKTVEWMYIGGHIGIPGNERADQMATEYALQKAPDLYHGTLGSYPINILNTQADAVLKKEKSSNKSRAGQKAYSYLSMIDGAIQIHKTWPECEARVKGKSGAKFKKALNPEEEKDIIDGWKK